MSEIIWNVGTFILSTIRSCSISPVPSLLTLDNSFELRPGFYVKKNCTLTLSSCIFVLALRLGLIETVSEIFISSGEVRTGNPYVK